MREYRAYVFGTDGHRFLKLDQFASDYPDDAAAMKAAERFVEGHDVELWDCGRLVARFDNKSRAVVASNGQILASLKMVADQSLVPAADIESKQQA